jgi:hypothetical protein
MSEPGIFEMTEKHSRRFEAALLSPAPMETLRDYALELSRSGMKRKEIYLIFREMFDKLKREGREVEQGSIEIILDSITQFMSPSNPLYLVLPE